MITTILIIILILMLVGAGPWWPYSTGWGPYPAGGLGPGAATVGRFGGSRGGLPTAAQNPMTMGHAKRLGH